MLKYISLGWGVQSFTLAAMVALGELPPIEAAIHADTLHERESTYEFAEQWAPWLEQRGVSVVRVCNAQPPNELLGFKTDLPAYTRSPRGIGQLKRQCTGSWKIEPMRRYISSELAERGLSKTPGVVTQLIGISWDEVGRIKNSDVKYIRNEWPLVDRRMTRDGCKRWLTAHGLPVPPKSSCTFCPFHNRAAWREMKQAGGVDWDEAVLTDLYIRDKRPPFDLFLSNECKPLSEIDFRDQRDMGQLELDLCAEGACFV